MHISTLLIIRSPLLRDALNRLLAGEGYTIVGETSKPENLDRVHAGTAPEEVDLVIIDGIIIAEHCQVMESIRHKYPAAKMVVFGSEPVEAAMSPSLIAYIDGLLSYQMSIQTLLQVIALVALGEKILPPGLMKRLFQQTVYVRTDPAKHRDASDITDRERQILEALLRGSSNKTIARQLELSEATVKVHLKGLLRRLRASNRTQAAVWALTHGIGYSLAGNEDARNTAISV